MRSSKFHSGVLIALLVLISIFAIPNSNTAEIVSPDQPVIIVGGEHSYPPYSFLDKDGRPSGFNVELTQAIADVMGMKVEVRLGAWAEMRKALNAGEIDVLQGMSYSEERAKIYDFSPPFTIVHHSIYARKGSPAVSSLQELADKEVIVEKDGIAYDYLRHSNIKTKLIVQDSIADALRLLASGKHDYAVVAMLPAEFLKRELELNNIVPVAKRIEARSYCYAFNKNSQELAARFAEGLAILRNSGKFQEIHRKWLGALEDQGLSWSTIRKYGSLILVPLLLLLIGTAVWSRMLKKQVAQRTAALSLEISERKKAEKELQDRHQQLIQAAKLSAIGTLTSGVAHEINNPNALILFNTLALKRAFADAEPILEDHYQKHGDFSLGGLKYSRMRTEIPLLISEMHDGAQQIKRIVEDLKDFARRDDPDFLESVDLNAVTRKAIRLVDNLIKKSTEHFRVQYADELPSFTGNPQRIEQVIVNLVVNACQALPDREKSISIKTSTDREHDWLLLEVADEGVGIDPENLAHITDPFFTTKREKGGTGLGLSLSCTIVKEHGGSLSFSSVAGRGTTVTLALPVKK
jgi:polar amino acid transport system substrate-binding protein